MAVGNYISAEFKDSIIKITDYDGYEVKGILQNAFFDSDISFGSFTELLLVLDKMFDGIGYPQRSEKRRYFGEVPRIEIHPASEVPETTIATFGLRVYFRQNASWQGRVRWLEGRTELEFRSCLELIYLLSSALEKKE